MTKFSEKTERQQNYYWNVELWIVRTRYLTLTLQKCFEQVMH